ncbi:PgpA protein [[Mannheimia] succiniciproducens MBEL55E]|uniref:Phosphatidylglycerophosphatase A n=2 Tax=Basfia TaxID=697331 RepID=Q65TY0_MANSM|nr:PgpA protein [[Mannheimia] succiniciproducens MBEL55E]
MMAHSSSTTNPLDKLSLRNPVHLLALGFGSGLIRPAPGTWGSLAAIIIGAPILHWIGTVPFLVLILLGFALGVYLCQKTADDMGVHDHGAIVWDEFIGIFITLLAIPQISLFWCIAAFVLFRIFDIIKPYPISYFDKRLESGFGIMVDDVLAAVYAAISLFLLHYII